ncbi:precorrin-6Y C5,15-methyltransferase (decarboxylating) subunit CbiT [Haloimpatiens sp. FM7315]|uniref:precorrin-6Y C5,15-methyltransferase (decarboxylating) subunit CbiT n=1 Tax=Haloimpatiens sp. FM7315 TaxID=3298609 RepID=UPI0035A383C7
MCFIKDEEFIRGNCPMTKEEIRILAVSKMKVKKTHNVLDVGAGTGSVSVQLSKICKEGKVVAIEKDEEALRVIDENKKKFQCSNLHIVKGEALLVEPSIKEKFNSIFIGGSGGDIEEIIRKYSLKLQDNGVMVLNFITLKNAVKAMDCLNALNYETEAIQVAINKVKGKSYMLMANNPIFIIEAKKKLL